MPEQLDSPPGRLSEVISPARLLTALPVFSPGEHDLSTTEGGLNNLLFTFNEEFHSGLKREESRR